MASDYGLNFGFRRSDESMAVREGRFKTPATGTPLLQGVAVQVDPANPGYLKQCAANAAPLTGTFGLLVQEESHIFGLFDVTVHDSISLGTTKTDQLSTIWCGAGTKVWFKNTPAYSRGNRSKAAVNMVDLTGVAVGDQLGWNGSKFVKAVAGTTPAWMTVTALSGTTYVEAVLGF